LKFTTEITLRNPPLDAEDADEARRRARETYEKLIEVLARSGQPPQIIEIAVHPVEDID